MRTKRTKIDYEQENQQTSKQGKKKKTKKGKKEEEIKVALENAVIELQRQTTWTGRVPVERIERQIKSEKMDPVFQRSCDPIPLQPIGAGREPVPSPPLTGIRRAEQRKDSRTFAHSTRLN